MNLSRRSSRCIRMKIATIKHNDGGLEGSKDRLDHRPSDREHRGLWRGELDDERLLLRAAEEEPPHRFCRLAAGRLERQPGRSQACLR